jgi:aminopeptidase N
VRGVMYEKGAYVLHMLRQMMRDQKEGDRPFMVMMHDFVQQHLNRNASTESFQRVVEKHMTPAMNIRGDGKMDWFFQEWVYGTAIPKYKLDYTLTEENGKTMLKGSVTQSEVTDDFIMLVPIYLDFDGQIARLGAAKLIGNSSIPVNVPLPKRPKRVLLNYMHDVLEQ